MKPPKDKEEALAGLLNGTMVTLLGSALLALLIVAVMWKWRDLRDGDPYAVATLIAAATGGLILCPRMILFGLRALRLNWATLRML